jgi:hypothetical protein
MLRRSIEAIGTVTEGLNRIFGKNIRKTFIRFSTKGTAYITRTVLQSET